MSEVQTYIGRPRRYENIDGTVEIFFGVMYLGFALQAYVTSTLPKGSHWAYATAGLLLIYPLILLGWWAGRIIKRRITWPRTGYVVPRQAANSKTAAFWTALVVAAAVGWVLIRLTKGQDLSQVARPLMLGSLVAPFALFTALNKEPSWKWLVALVLALGLSVIGMLVPGPAAELFRPASVFTGLTFLASGLLTLYLYIGHTQPPAPEPE